MKIYKKIFPALLAIIFGLVVFAVPAAAVNPVEQVCKDASGSPVCEAGQSNNSILGANGFMTKIVQMFVYIAGVISVIGLTVAGLQYTMANGDPGAIQTAKNSALYSLVGLLVAVFAQAIVSFVLSKL